jgi:hypothetical protein
MNIESLRRTGSGLFLIALLALASWPGVAATQDDSAQAVVPLNAHMRSHGGGWECDRGYRSVRGSCVAVEVPTNAYLNSLGNGWDCNRGYRKANGACVKIEVPPHAFLGSRGSGWQCDRGYRGVDQSCITVEVPPNAHLADSYRSGSISTLPGTAGNANEDSTRAATRAHPSRSLRKDSWGVLVTIGNAIAVTGSATSRASRSRCLQTATSTPRDATGTASEASREDSVRAWPSRCR